MRGSDKRTSIAKGVSYLLHYYHEQVPDESLTDLLSLNLRQDPKLQVPSLAPLEDEQTGLERAHDVTNQLTEQLDKPRPL